MSLPQKLPLDLMQTQWGQQLNPLIDNPIMQGLAIYNISLPTQIPTSIPTTLSRQQLGWFLIDNTTDSRVWRAGPFTANTLTLEASSATTISIWVF